MTEENTKIESTDNKSDNNEDIIFEWMTHPMRKRPVTAMLVIVFILVTSMLVFYATASKLFTGLALIVLFASTAKFFLPTRFKMTDKQVIIKTTTQKIKKNWKNFRSFYPDKNGVLLSPFLEPSRLENFRGMYLIFADNKEEVVNQVKQHINVDENLIVEDKESIS